MASTGKWESIKELGKGGQGKVWLVRDTSKADKSGYLQRIVKAVSYLGAETIKDKNTVVEFSKMLDESLTNFVHSDDSLNLGALKVLYKPEESKDYEKALERMKKEIQALSTVQHPNVLKVLDYDPEGKWFVGEYHQRGPLSKFRELYKGKLLGALEEFHSLVEGVSSLHKQKLVHRDIKPHNVFVAHNGQLVLGDLGIVYFADEAHTRISSAFENVGSRDWMPPWSMSMRVEDVRPSFDVFSLGKLLWSMVSGQPVLPLWYFNKPQFDLEEMFPNDPDIRWAKRILERCIVEEEKDCMPSAEKLLELVDETIFALRRHTDVVKDGVVRRCTVCGLGEYQSIASGSSGSVRNFGISPAGASGFKIFTCTHCGHVQMFHLRDARNPPPAWKS